MTKVESFFDSFMSRGYSSNQKVEKNTEQVVNGDIMFPHFLVQNCFMFNVRESIVVHAVGPSCRKTRIVKVEDFFQQSVAKFVRKKWKRIDFSRHMFRQDVLPICSSSVQK